MANLPPRRNPTPTKISKQNLTPLQTLLQMGFPKHRAEKALAATGFKGAQLAADWLLAHVNDPLIDDNSPREYILYVCPSAVFLEQLQEFWSKSLRLCGWNGAHNFLPHITLVSFFKAPDQDVPHLTQSLKTIMDRQGAVLNESLKLENYISPNFMGFFVLEEHADYLKRIAMQYVKEVSNITISLEPHVKSLHLTLAYQFPNLQYQNLKNLVEELNSHVSSNWELRLYSRDSRVNGKQVHKVIHPYTPTESDELELRIGDYIYINGDILKTTPDGWIEGTSWLTGLTGFLPASYTERTAESDAWTLHKKIPINSVTPSSLEENVSSVKSDDVTSADNMNNFAFTQHSVLNNEEVKPLPPPGIPEVPPDPVKENFYENLIGIMRRKEASLPTDENSSASRERRSVFIMRHGERIDFAFGSWVPFCFNNESGTFQRKDLNMPKNLPERKNGAAAYFRDSPLTNIGNFEARLVGEALKDNNIQINHVFCSPSYRCIQTCDSVLEGLCLKDDVKIKIEPGLFEWMAWYSGDYIPEWMTTLELLNCGFNIDSTYQPLISEKELKETRENCEQFYLRSAFITRSCLAASTGNILLVGHTATLETCSRELIGKSARSGSELVKLIQKIPYCSIIEVKNNNHHETDDDNWEIVEPPCLPLTHSTNQRFDWKVLL